jgi:hypothetical protein
MQDRHIGQATPSEVGALRCIGPAHFECENANRTRHPLDSQPRRSTSYLKMALPRGIEPLFQP